MCCAYRVFQSVQVLSVVGVHLTYEQGRIYAWGMAYGSARLGPHATIFLLRLHVN